MLNATSLVVDKPLTHSFTLTTTSTVEAEEVAQVCLSDLATFIPTLQYKMVAFQRARLRFGESQRVTFTLTSAALSLVDEEEEGQLQLKPGYFASQSAADYLAQAGVALELTCS